LLSSFSFQIETFSVAVPQPSEGTSYWLPSYFTLGPDPNRVNLWTSKEVFQWAKIITDEEEATKLRNQKVDGEVLLTLTKEELRSLSIPLGSATKLASAITKLKSPKGIP
jgi:hypothetical protein